MDKENTLEKEANDDVQQRQEENAAALVMNTFFKVANDGSATAEDITNYLLNKFGDIWQVDALTIKAEEVLKRNTTEGLLERQGDRFIAALVRETTSRKRKRSPGRVGKRKRRCKSRSSRRKRPCK